MAFTLNTFQFARGVASCSNNGTGVGTVTHGYKNTNDNYVTITTSGYFPNSIDGSTDKIFVDDLIFIIASDTVGLALVTNLAPFTVGSNLLGTAGSPITISAPNVAVDGNGAVISGTMFNLEIADQMHPGIITTSAQAFSGTKNFLSGILLMTSGGTPTVLNYYEEFPFTTTFTLGTQTSAAITLNIIRVGSIITIANSTPAGEVSTPPQATPGAFYAANTVLPARFTPMNFANGAWQVLNAGVTSSGLINIDSSGHIRIFNNPDATTPFASSQINGFRNDAITFAL